MSLKICQQIGWKAAYRVIEGTNRRMNVFKSKLILQKRLYYQVFREGIYKVQGPENFYEQRYLYVLTVKFLNSSVQRSKIGSSLKVKTNLSYVQNPSHTRYMNIHPICGQNPIFWRIFWSWKIHKSEDTQSVEFNWILFLNWESM